VTSGLRSAIACTLMMTLTVTAACDEEQAPVPAAFGLPSDAVGYYCGMLVAEHSGPKGQIILASRQEPIWFSSVRDTIAFTVLPEEAKDISAIYVTDLSRTAWDSPAPDVWVDARHAWYVIGSGRAGGMGAPEAAPFSDRADAAAFALEYGGRIVKIQDIPDAFVLGGMDGDGMPDQAGSGDERRDAR